MKEIAERLKVLRQSVALSQSKLAELMGITQASVNRYENAQALPSVKILLRYGDFFDVSMDYILCRTDQPQGKVYQCEPKLAEAMAETNSDIKQFVNMCFDPKSPISAKLKQVLTQMLEEERQ